MLCCGAGEFICVWSGVRLVVASPGSGFLPCTSSWLVVGPKGRGCDLWRDGVIAPTGCSGAAASVQDRWCVRQEMFSTDHASCFQL